MGVSPKAPSSSLKYHVFSQLNTLEVRGLVRRRCMKNAPYRFHLIHAN